MNVVLVVVEIRSMGTLSQLHVDYEIRWIIWQPLILENSEMLMPLKAYEDPDSGGSKKGVTLNGLFTELPNFVLQKDQRGLMVN